MIRNSRVPFRANWVFVLVLLCCTVPLSGAGESGPRLSGHIGVPEPKSIGIDAHGAELPESAATEVFRPTLTLEITRTEIWFECESIARLAEGRLSPAEAKASSPVPSLTERLAKVKHLAVLDVLADRNIPVETLMEVLRTAAASGFPYSRLVVHRHGSAVEMRAIRVSSPKMSSLDPVEIANFDGWAVDASEPVLVPRMKVKARPRVTLMLRVTDQGISIEITAASLTNQEQEAGRFDIPKAPAGYDLQKVSEAASKVSAKYPESDTAVVIADGKFDYATLVAILDALRDVPKGGKSGQQPSGFTKVVLTAIARVD